MQNHQIVFTAKGKVELQSCDMPQPAEGEFLVQTTVSQISIGTELTYLQGNVEPGMNWEKDVVFPRRPGYNNVGKIIAVGQGVSPELIGRKIQSGQKHVKYFTMKEADTEQYRLIPEGVKDEEAVFGHSLSSCLPVACGLSYRRKILYLKITN